MLDLMEAATACHPNRAETVTHDTTCLTQSWHWPLTGFEVRIPRRSLSVFARKTKKKRPNKKGSYAGVGWNHEHADDLPPCPGPELRPADVTRNYPDQLRNRYHDADGRGHSKRRSFLLQIIGRPFRARHSCLHAAFRFFDGAGGRSNEEADRSGGVEAGVGHPGHSTWWVA